MICVNDVRYIFKVIGGGGIFIICFIMLLIIVFDFFIIIMRIIRNIWKYKEFCELEYDYKIEFIIFGWKKVFFFIFLSNYKSIFFLVYMKCMMN